MKNQSGLKNPLAFIMRWLQAEPHNPIAAVKYCSPSPTHHPSVLTSENDTCRPAPQASSLSRPTAPTQSPSQARVLDHCPVGQAQGSPNKTQGSPGTE